MQKVWTSAIAGQLEAATRMFEKTIQDCPEHLWTASLWVDDSAPAGFADFWYLAYHTLFWLDLYLSGAVEGFTPPAPFTLAELDPAGVLPAQVYRPAELLAYLEHCRQKARAILHGLTDEQARRRCSFPWGDVAYAELLLDNMRHVQEHGAQLRMFLGQQAAYRPRWLGT